MDVSQCIMVSVHVFMLVLHLPYMNLLTVSDTITEHSTFYLEKLSKYPSKKVTIELYVKYFRKDLILDFYTFDDNLHIQRNCSFQKFSQLRNEDFRIPLRPGEYRFNFCDTQNFGYEMLHCHGITTVQDYKPRNFAFSFGFECNKKSNNSISLKGLSFEIKLYGETNQTECTAVTNVHPNFNCLKFYSSTTFPNLIGIQDIDAAHDIIDFTNYLVDIYSTIFRKFDCYQHFEEFLCYTIAPKCNSTTNQMISVCRESCHDFLNGCLEFIVSKIPGIMELERANMDISDLSDLQLNYNDILCNCNYLPSVNGSIPCFYKPIKCETPPNITNACLDDKSIHGSKNFPLHSIVKYSCQDKQFQMVGNDTITCEQSGQWSEPPQCVKESNVTPLVIVLPMLTMSLLLYLAIRVAFRCIQRKASNLIRNKMFDAFVCYAFDSENHFVINSVLPELEEKCNPPFKLCAHERNFDPGRHIMENIQEAIENSNTAIIVVSQDFVDSMWCREEFAHCYIENMKDPAFRLFVIMMQPPDTLVNLTKYMRKFMAHKTYLDKNDPNLFEKIARYMKWIKQPKGEVKSDETDKMEEEERFINDL